MFSKKCNFCVYLILEHIIEWDFFGAFALAQKCQCEKLAKGCVWTVCTRVSVRQKSDERRQDEIARHSSSTCQAVYNFHSQNLA